MSGFVLSFSMALLMLSVGALFNSVIAAKLEDKTVTFGQTKQRENELSLFRFKTLRQLESSTSPAPATAAPVVTVTPITVQSLASSTATTAIAPTTSALVVTVTPIFSPATTSPAPATTAPVVTVTPITVQSLASSTATTTIAPTTSALVVTVTPIFSPPTTPGSFSLGTTEAPTVPPITIQPSCPNGAQPTEVVWLTQFSVCIPGFGILEIEDIDGVEPGTRSPDGTVTFMGIPNFPANILLEEQVSVIQTSLSGGTFVPQPNPRCGRAEINSVERKRDSCNLLLQRGVRALQLAEQEERRAQRSFDRKDSGFRMLTRRIEQLEGSERAALALMRNGAPRSEFGPQLRMARRRLRMANRQRSRALPALQRCRTRLENAQRNVAVESGEVTSLRMTLERVNQILVSARARYRTCKENQGFPV